MALVEKNLRDAIYAVLKANSAIADDSIPADPEAQIEQSINNLADGIASAVHSYVTKADVITVSVDPNTGKSIPPPGKLS